MDQNYILYVRLEAIRDVDPDAMVQYYHIVRRRSRVPGRPLQKHDKIYDFLKAKNYNLPFSFSNDPTELIMKYQLTLDDFILTDQQVPLVTSNGATLKDEEVQAKFPNFWKTAELLAAKQTEISAVASPKEPASIEDILEQSILPALPISSQPNPIAAPDHSSIEPIIASKTTDLSESENLSEDTDSSLNASALPGWGHHKQEFGVLEQTDLSEANESVVEKLENTAVETQAKEGNLLQKAAGLVSDFIGVSQSTPRKNAKPEMEQPIPTLRANSSTDKTDAVMATSSIKINATRYFPKWKDAVSGSQDEAWDNAETFLDHLRTFRDLKEHDDLNDDAVIYYVLSENGKLDLYSELPEDAKHDLEKFIDYIGEVYLPSDSEMRKRLRAIKQKPNERGTQFLWRIIRKACQIRYINPIPSLKDIESKEQYDDLKRELHSLFRDGIRNQATKQRLKSRQTKSLTDLVKQFDLIEDAFRETPNSVNFVDTDGRWERLTSQMEKLTKDVQQVMFVSTKRYPNYGRSRSRDRDNRQRGRSYSRDRSRGRSFPRSRSYSRDSRRSRSRDYGSRDRSFSRDRKERGRSSSRGYNSDKRRSKSRPTSTNKETRRCYYCKRLGHIMKDCYTRNRDKRKANGKN